ncbi:MAG: hypothetical protein M3Y68_11160 [Chloroflexota bacterium]|nr:hypothetical protein [Chloroflexota bacterium]
MSIYMSESLVCNMNVFTPAEREAHILATTRLMVSTQSVREWMTGPLGTQEFLRVEFSGAIQ